VSSPGTESQWSTRLCNRDANERIRHTNVNVPNQFDCTNQKVRLFLTAPVPEWTVLPGVVGAAG
jgi:hypothetical protein